MRIPLEDRLLYAVLALLVLAAFLVRYIGVLLLYGNLLTLGFSVFAIAMLHLQILQEERYLVSTFGAPYQEYCRHVFRYLGRK